MVISHKSFCARLCLMALPAFARAEANWNVQTWGQLVGPGCL